MYNRKSLVGIVLFVTLVITGCNKWKDHNEVTQQDLSINLLQAVSSNPDLSKFREYVGTSGLDSLLQATKAFTIWAPTNAAMAAIDPATVADKAKLRMFILNHISNQLYFTKDVSTQIRIQMLSGKYNNFSTLKFDEAALVTTDRYVTNGVLHTINAIVPPLQSIWDFITSTTSTYAQNAYVAGQNYNAFDPTKAIIDSVSVVTGLPIYRPGTGLVQRNYFNDKVVDLKREDKQYTYFVMQNTNFVVETDSLKTYFSAATTTITDSLTRWNVVKDLAYDTLYKNALAIPTTLTSKFGITVPISSAYVVEAKRMSNGYVYVMSKVDVLTKNKFLPIILQGENPSGFIQYDKTAFTNYRVRMNPVTNISFSDLLVSGHGVTGFYSFYRTNDLPSMKYQVYALATNDFQTGALTDSIVAFNYFNNANAGTLAHVIPLYTVAGAYNEVYLGDITNTKFSTVDWRLKATTNGPILLDYIRLVPVP